MQVFINGEFYESKAETLSDLLIECEYEAALVATAINRDFVRLKDRDAVRLKSGDRIEILTPRQGG